MSTNVDVDFNKFLELEEITLDNITPKHYKQFEHIQAQQLINNSTFQVEYSRHRLNSLNPKRTIEWVFQPIEEDITEQQLREINEKILNTEFNEDVPLVPPALPNTNASTCPLQTLTQATIQDQINSELIEELPPQPTTGLGRNQKNMSAIERLRDCVNKVTAAPPPKKKRKTAATASIKPDKRGRPSKNEILGKVSIEEAIKLSHSYNTKEISFNGSKTKIFTRSQSDIICSCVEQYNYFNYLNARKAKLLDKIDKYIKEFKNIDNIEAYILFVDN